jgi:hypothetical protein
MRVILAQVLTSRGLSSRRDRRHFEDLLPADLSLGLVVVAVSGHPTSQTAAAIGSTLQVLL